MPGNTQAYSTAMSAADSYRWNSQWGQAMQEYQRALQEFPEDVPARSGIGFCFMQTKQWRQSLDEYEYILKRDPNNVIVLSKIAELYGILNRREEAFQAYLHLADLYMQGSQGERAEAAWQKALQLSPGNPEPHERLANYYFEKKEIALMIQQRLIAAQGYLRRNEPGAARTQCEEVLRADGGNKQARDMLAHILKRAEGLPVEERGREFGSVPGRQGLEGGEEPGYAAEQSPTISSSFDPKFTNNSVTETVTSGNISGGNTGIMGNMGSAGNFGGGQSGPAPAVNGVGAASAPRKRISASQVTGVLKQAQAFQAQGRFNDAIDLCEQILESGFDRPDARYFLGWLYQELQRWDDAIRQFQLLLNDPDYALSCYYALGQCYRARGDLRTATVHFDEAVDRVNLDALTLEESDQLVQLCQEAAEAHRLLGEQEQAFTVYSALLGFLRSRGWSDKITQVEAMLQQAQNAPVPARPVTPPPNMQADQMQTMLQAPPPQHQPMPPSIPSSAIVEAPTMAFDANALMQQNGAAPPPIQHAQPMQPAGTASGDLPDWLTGILDSDKTQIAQPPAPPPASRSQPLAHSQPLANSQPLAHDVQRINSGDLSGVQQPYQMNQVAPPPPPMPAPTSEPMVSSPSWLTGEVAPPPPSTTYVLPPEQMAALMAQHEQTFRPAPPQQQAQVQAQAKTPSAPLAPAPPPPPVVPQQAPPQQQVAQNHAIQAPLPPMSEQLYLAPAPSQPLVAIPETKPAAEDLLKQIAGLRATELGQGAEPVLASTASLPENVRNQVVRSMQDIQRYINHGLLTSATEECLRVIDIAPQYLDVHQVLCEIYVRQGKIEQAVTKYAILVDTYVVHSRIDDAIATYRRILQLEPNNLNYRKRLIDLLSTQGNKEDLLRERTLAAESYLRLGYMDRALTELELALQESPTSVSTRLNYALALQKLGRIPQATAEYQRVLQVDPRNLTALIRWHLSMITGGGTPRATTLEVLARIRWQLRGEGQKQAEMTIREYQQAVDIYPNNADVHFSLGQMYHQSGVFDKAIDSYLLSIRDTSVEILARASAAQSLLAQGRPDSAIQHFEQALQIVRRSTVNIDPSVWAARPREEGEEHQAPEMEISVQLAKAYGRSGKVEQMENILRQVRHSRPAENEVSSTLAEISSRRTDTGSTLQEYMDLVRHYRQNRQTDNAITALNEMVRLAPQDPRAHEELSEIYIQRGLLDEGLAEMRLLVDIYLRLNRPEDASEKLQRIGNIHDEMGNPEEALNYLCRAAELNTKSMDLLREVVGFCYRVSRIHEAVKYQTIIARHYFETHQVKEAVAALQQLIALDRSNMEAYDMLGQTYQAVGEYEQASRVYRNLAKVHPGSSIARDRLATLQELRMR